MPYLGETLAFLTAIIWAFAVILFKKSGESVHPIALNLFKNTIAFSLFIPTIFIVGEKIFPDAPFNDYFILILSGIIGIGIGDTLFFKSLNILGASMSAIVDCMYSPSVIFFSILLLGEKMTLVQSFGTLLIISAILTAVSPRARENLTKKELMRGIFWGILAMVSTGFGIVIAKPVLDRSPLFWVTEIRLFGGIVALLIFLSFMPHRRKITASVFTIKNWKYTLSGSFIGAYIAMAIWLAGMKYTKVSIAAALNQTSNIFIFIFAAFLLKEPINLQRIIAIFLGVFGAVLVTFG